MTVRAESDLSLQLAPFGTAPDGSPVALYALRAARGMQVELMSYGATLVRLRILDSSGAAADVALGFERLEDYLRAPGHLGASIGRFANRISQARFTLGGREHRLSANEGAHHLHGGRRGFDQVVWRHHGLREAEAVGVRFEHSSPDGDEGYPGNLEAAVTYRLTTAGELRIDFEATADAPTVVSMTQHAYWNLRDGGASDVLGHELLVLADHYTPVDDERIPTGKIEPVQGTRFDFTSSRSIAGAYDHNLVLRGAPGRLRPAVRLRDPASQRVLELQTTEPGLQLYTGNFLDGALVGRGGVRYRRHAGVCLEPQRFPDAPNQPQFPSCLLEPGARYAHTSVYRFTPG